MIIGITGQTASGKTTISKYLAHKYNFHYIEVDKIVERIMTKGKINDIKDSLERNHQVYSKSCYEIGDSFFFYDINSYIMDLNFKRGDKFDISKYCCIDNVHHSYNASRYHYIVNTESEWENQLSEFIEENILSLDLVSVIIPAYNVEQYLVRCVDSILNQSYRNLEIIIVDDGSTDNTLAVAKVLEKKDKRIKVIHHDNKGLSEARNTGIMSATGEFISFVDADDFIEKGMINGLLKNIKETNADVSCGRAFIHSRNGIVRHPNNNPKEVQVIIDKEQLIDSYLNGTITMAAWDKLYRKSALDNIWFDGDTFNEDADFILKLCLGNKKFVCDTTKYYHYVKRNVGSLTGSKFNDRCFLTQKWGYKAYKEILSLGNEYEPKAEICLFNSLTHVLKMFMKDYVRDCSIADEYKDKIQLLANDIMNLLLNTKDVKKIRDLDNVLSIINRLLDENVLERGKMPTIKIPCIGILWNSLDKEQMDEAIRMLSKKSFIESIEFADLEEDYRKFIEEIYLYNNEKVGIPVFKSSVLIDKYDSNSIAIINLIIKVSNYQISY